MKNHRNTLRISNAFVFNWFPDVCLEAALCSYRKFDSKGQKLYMTLWSSYLFSLFAWQGWQQISCRMCLMWGKGIQYVWHKKSTVWLTPSHASPVKKRKSLKDLHSNTLCLKLKFNEYAKVEKNMSIGDNCLGYWLKCIFACMHTIIKEDWVLLSSTFSSEN